MASTMDNFYPTGQFALPNDFTAMAYSQPLGHIAQDNTSMPSEHPTGQYAHNFTTMAPSHPFRQYAPYDTTMATSHSLGQYAQSDIAMASSHFLGQDAQHNTNMAVSHPFGLYAHDINNMAQSHTMTTTTTTTPTLTGAQYSAPTGANWAVFHAQQQQQQQQAQTQAPSADAASGPIMWSPNTPIPLAPPTFGAITPIAGRRASGLITGSSPVPPPGYMAAPMEGWEARVEGDLVVVVEQGTPAKKRRTRSGKGRKEPVFDPVTGKREKLKRISRKKRLEMAEEERRSREAVEEEEAKQEEEQEEQEEQEAAGVTEEEDANVLESVEGSDFLGIDLNVTIAEMLERAERERDGSEKLYRESGTTDLSAPVFETVGMWEVLNDSFFTH